MKRLCTSLTAAVLLLWTAGIAPGHAEEDGIDKAKTEAFDARIFAKPPGKTNYACFVRRYDAAHLARHVKQKVSAMKLLMTAEIPSDENTLNYSFRVGVKFRHRSGDFDSSGNCRHIIAGQTGNEIRFGCGVDCDGGGIDVALSQDDKSVTVRLERARLWRHNKPDEEADHSLGSGADDKAFRLERVEARECESLVTDRKEIAALRQK